MFFFLLLILNYKYSIGFDDLNSIKLEEKNIESLEKGIFYWGKGISYWQKEEGSNLKLRKGKNDSSYIYKEQKDIAYIKRINKRNRNVLSFHLVYLFASSYGFINNKTLVAYQSPVLIFSKKFNSIKSITELLDLNIKFSINNKNKYL